MAKHAVIFTGVLLFTPMSALWCQKPFFVAPEGLNVCQSSVISAGLLNERPDTLFDIRLTLDLPCGLEYIPGTVSGAAEGNISQPNQAQFEIPVLSPGDSISLSWEVVVSCRAATCIDNGELFQHALRIEVGSQSNYYLSPIYNVETGYPVLHRIEDPLIKASKGDMVQRKVTIKNTRPGRIEYIDFTDQYSSGITIAIPGRTVINSDSASLTIRLDESDFQQLGNGDAYFDFNEEITIIEEIDVYSCAFEKRYSQSLLRVQWGCDSTYCHSYSRRANIQIESDYDSGDILSASTERNEAFCQQGGGDVKQRLTFHHEGTAGKLYNVKIHVKQVTDGYTVKAGSVQLNGVQGAISYQNETEADKCSGKGYEQFTIHIPEVHVGEKPDIRWDTRPCILGCKQGQNAWTYTYSYEKECAPSDERYIFRGPHNVGSKDLPAILGELEMEPNGFPFPLKKSDTSQVIQKLRHPALNTSGGSMLIVMQMPCDLLPLDNGFILNGINPLRSEIATSSSHNYLTLEYELPFDRDEVMLKFNTVLTCDEDCTGTDGYPEYITSCPMTCSGTKATGEIKWEVRINPDGQCEAGNEVTLCDKTEFQYDCGGIAFNDTVPGYLDYSLRIYRTTYGRPDNDNDHRADASGQLDFDKIALQNVIPGDTFLYDFQGVVIEDVPGKARFSHGLWTMHMEVENFRFKNSLDDPEEYLDNFFNEEQRIRILTTELRIYDKSEEGEYVLKNVPVFYDPFNNDLDFNLNSLALALENPGFPADFLYEKGDSVELKVTNILDYNFPQNSGNTKAMDISIEHKGFLDTMAIDKKKSFHCRCAETHLGIRGYKVYQQAFGNRSRNYCKPDFLLAGIQYRIEVHYDQSDFPFEVRSPYNFRELQVQLGEDIVLDSILFFRSHNSQNGEHLSISERTFDLTEIYGPFIDEDVFVKFALFGKGDECLNPYSDESIQLKCVISPQENPAYYDTIYLEYSPDIKKQQSPKLEPVVNNPNIESETDTLNWEYELVVRSANSLNTWIKVEESPYYRIIEFVSPTHSIMDELNGIYQLGEVPEGDTIIFNITAISQSCREIVIPLHFGSNCSPKTYNLQHSCSKFNDELYGYLLSGKSESFVQSSDTIIPLCQETASLTTTIFNADLGHLKDIKTSIEFPPGTRLIPGSVQLAIPTGNSFWHTVADPVFISPRTYLWDWRIVAPMAFENGLNGVDEVPENGFDLRFQFTTDCNFISGSKIIYRTVGDQYCGQNANTISKVSGSVHIEGIESAYNSSIGLHSFNEASCLEEGGVTFSVSVSGTVKEKDSLYVQLPAGYRYKDSSALLPPKINGNLLSWPLDSALQTDSFPLLFHAMQGVNCGQDILSVYTAGRDSAFCVEDSMHCELSVINGRIDLPVFYTLPEVSIQSLALHRSYGGGIYDIEVDVENISGVDLNSLTIDFYLDSDSIPGYSTNDTFLFSHLHTDILRAGTTAAISLDSLFISLNSVCRLLAVVPKNKNCLCRTDEAYMEKPLRFTTDSTLLACPNEVIDVGVSPQAGFRYQWEEIGLVHCDTCARTSFFAENNSQNVRSYNFTLLSENEESCALEYNISVDVQPMPRILSDQQTICPGDTILLIATDGATYNWRGNDIVLEDENSIVAAPKQSGHYSVEITDELGCMARDSVFVEVLPPAIADAGPDKLFCYGEIDASLEAQYIEGLEYRWLYAEHALTDHRAASTDIAIESSRAYVLEVFNGLCFDYDTVYVEYEKGIELTGLPDSLIECVATPLNLNVEGGTEYQWIPYYNGMCVDSACSETRITMPADTFELMVIGRDEEGCVDTLFSHLGGYIDTPFIEIDTTLCLYEELNWRQYHITKEGTYCDTFSLDGLCAEVTCLTVDFIDMDTLLVFDTLCLGDTAVFFDRSINDEGTYFYQPDSMTCDTVHRLEVSYFKKIEEIRDTTYVRKDMCEDIQLFNEDIFEYYSWTPAQGLSCVYCPSPFVTNNDTGQYTLTVQDVNGCVEDFTYLIHYENCRDREIYVPNIFSPNLDGINDVFTVYPRKNVLAIEDMRIFNRWGDLVYGFRGRGSNAEVPVWDGRFKGRDCSPGVYVYSLAVRWQDGTVRRFSGDVTIIR